MAESLLSQLDISDGGYYTMIAAIDFGTTYSGYAFSFVSKPNDICMNKNWGEGQGFQSYKTPTSVLTGPDSEFIAFGHDAEKRYTQVEEKGSTGYQLFKHFKMILHKQQELNKMAESLLSQLDISDGGYYTMIAAIDFGTTYSGYAFSFVSKPNDICMNKNWGEGQGFQSYKTPTSVLTGPDSEFIAFGHDAEKRYTQVEEKGSTGYQLFKHFKMILHKQQHLKRTTTVSSVSGHIMPAMDIFVMAIKYLKEHLLEAVGKQVESKPDAKMVKWVITVPAIWSEEAKNFMREAAFKAGCISEESSKQLLVALEPEAAGLYCREIDVKQFVVAENLKNLSFKSETKYLVIDAGGGTVDITAHEVLLNGDVKELLIANGGDWGGTQVDNAFVNVLKKVLGADFINAYKVQCPQNWLSLVGSFEMQKKSITHDDSSRITLPLPWSMGTKYNEICQKNIEVVLNDSPHLGVSFQNGSIFFTHSASLALFDDVLHNMCHHVQGLFKQESLESLSYVILVGGFGESKILQKTVKDILPFGVKFLVPPEAQLAVIKGAIAFAHNIKLIKSRKSRKTFGTDIANDFIEGVHDNNKRSIEYGKSFCLNVFQVLVKKGDSVELGKKMKISRCPLSPTQTSITTKIYSTDDDHLDELKYVTDPKFKKLGEVIINIPILPNSTNRFDREVEIEFEFGFTEIAVTAKYLATGQVAKVKFDLLQ